MLLKSFALLAGMTTVTANGWNTNGLEITRGRTSITMSGADVDSMAQVDMYGNMNIRDNVGTDIKRFIWKDSSDKILMKLDTIGDYVLDFSVKQPNYIAVIVMNTSTGNKCEHYVRANEVYTMFADRFVCDTLNFLDSSCGELGPGESKEKGTNQKNAVKTTWKSFYHQGTDDWTVFVEHKCTKGPFKNAVGVYECLNTGSGYSNPGLDIPDVCPRG